MSRWTAAELAALQEAGRDYEVFGALTGYSKSYDAFEVKGRRLGVSGAASLRGLEACHGSFCWWGRLRERFSR